MRSLLVPLAVLALSCAASAAHVAGTPGDDVIAGTDSPDVLNARAGDDTVSALGGRDVAVVRTGEAVAPTGCEIVRTVAADATSQGEHDDPADGT